ncbi:MAG: proton-conducting transporter membrane subunit [Sulfolobales archaeon]|nr:hypothetical protein [Sulfolobales archaeon]MCX8199649.1 proton-conducting transporter membrane subunit [Sulfolobales archaeon]MDW8170603.1 proton-conducting transporter membrane subunit [Desulfurococcaceae archaeon]
MVVELGLIPFTYLASTALVALLSATILSKKVIDAIAVLSSISGFALTLKLFLVVSNAGIALYRFGGFPPPLGVVYVADEASSMLALLTSFALLSSTLYAVWLIAPEARYIYYILTFLLMAGVHGCLFTGDVFNFYVSVELVAISSYAITGFYRDRPRAVRAAIIYGIAGTIVTSFLLLASFMLYGSYGTLNMADISMKARNPSAITMLSGGIHGDIVLVSKVSLTLITWVLLFKSGIMPNHFWLPEAYRAAPLPAVALFTATADIVGVYGLMRFYYSVFTKGIVVEDFRATILKALMFMGAASTVIAALLVARQRTVRGLVAYSSVSQFSLALLGLTAETSEAIAGSLLHLIVNGLGDMAVLYSVGILQYMLRSGGKLIFAMSRAALIIGLLNLFGILPILPGFWSKTYLTLGFIQAGMPHGAALVLISTGLCAVGYLRTIIRLLSLSEVKQSVEQDVERNAAIPIFTLSLLVAVTIALGMLLLLSSNVREAAINYGSLVMDVERYVNKVLSST